MEQKIKLEVTRPACEKYLCSRYCDRIPRACDSFSQLKTNMFKIAKGYDSVSKTIRIPEPVVERLETLAAENNISLNQLVNQCIHFALEHLYIGEYSPNDNNREK